VLVYVAGRGTADSDKRKARNDWGREKKGVELVEKVAWEEEDIL
jgi:hypothetical protein